MTFKPQNEILLLTNEVDMWTVFSDMYSGGDPKTKYNKIVIELPLAKAIKYFKYNFSDPDNITCECCGPDYTYYEYTTLPKEITENEFTKFVYFSKINPKVSNVKLFTTLKNRKFTF